jgi:hypothetical protein
MRVEADVGSFYGLQQLLPEGYIYPPQERALETILHQEAQLRPEFETLKSTPGIGNVLAATIMLETGTNTRFADVGHLSSYLPMR